MMAGKWFSLNLRNFAQSAALGAGIIPAIWSAAA